MENVRPDGEMMMRYRYGSRTGFLGALARPYRLRTGRCGSADRGLNCTNRMPGVGGSQIGKPSTALLRKYRTPSHLLGLSSSRGELGMHVFTFGGLTLSSADHMLLGWFL